MVQGNVGYVKMDVGRFYCVWIRQVRGVQIRVEIDISGWSWLWNGWVSSKSIVGRFK